MNTRRARPETGPADRDAAALAPDFCNFGIVLRVLLGANLLAAAAAVVAAGSADHVRAAFLAIAALLEPTVLLTLGSLCALSSRLKVEQRGARAVSAAGVGAVVALVVQLALAWAYPGTGNDSSYAFATIAIIAALGAAATMHYFDLRARAFSPAFAAARLQALQSRIRPHFLFNSFNAAISLVRSDPKRAERVLEDLSDIFRMLMRDSREFITLEEEIELARQYLAIEQVRLGDRMDVEWDIQRLPRAHRVPPLLLQPLLENAVQHGIEPSEARGRIAVRITGMARELVIVVENSYVPDAVRPGNGVALGNIRERLRLVFDLEAQLKASGDGRLYRVVITLPAPAATLGPVNRP